MENRKKIIIATLVIATLAVIGLFVWLLLRPKPQAVIEPNANANINIAAANANVASDALPPPTPQRLQEEKNYPLGLKQLAAAFAERYGSYSTDEPFNNLLDLKPLMTLRMQQQAADYMAQNTSTFVVAYSGYNTRALSEELISADSASAVILVKTQRAQYTGDSGAPQLTYPSLLIKFVKIGNEWRADSVGWQ